MTRGVFVTGTDTGVGKTRVACLIAQSLVASGHKVAVMKPVAAGAQSSGEGLRNEDALALMACANVPAAYATVNPVCLRAPIAPHIAAAEEGVRIRTSDILSRFAELERRADWVVVEGAGGWLVPLSAEETMADLARALGLPVVLVVGLRLGCLNHAFLTARAIRSAGLTLHAWIANEIDPSFERRSENLATLEQGLGLPPAAIVPHATSAGEGPQLAADFARKFLS